jgi:hypothetical protein
MRTEKDMESKNCLVVCEKLPEALEVPVASAKRPWKSYDCIDKGFVSVTASLVKACYQSGEKLVAARVHEVDNVSNHPIYVTARLNRFEGGHILISESMVKCGKFDAIMPDPYGPGEHIVPVYMEIQVSQPKHIPTLQMIRRVALHKPSSWSFQFLLRALPNSDRKYVDCSY